MCINIVLMFRLITSLHKLLNLCLHLYFSLLANRIYMSAIDDTFNSFYASKRILI